mgnify:FL=1
MQRRRRPRDPDQTATYAELKMYYKQLVEELDECHRNRRASEQLSKSRYGEAAEAKTEAKKIRRDLVTISKKQKAKEEASKAGYWSGGAAIFVTIIYEVCKVSGFPGGREWIEFWQHEAVFGLVMWMVTMLFGWAYKSMHPESK